MEPLENGLGADNTQPSTEQNASTETNTQQPEMASSEEFSVEDASEVTVNEVDGEETIAQTPSDSQPAHTESLSERLKSLLDEPSPSSEASLMPSQEAAPLREEETVQTDEPQAISNPSESSNEASLEGAHKEVVVHKVGGEVNTTEDQVNEPLHEVQEVQEEAAVTESASEQTSPVVDDKIEDEADAIEATKEVEPLPSYDTFSVEELIAAATQLSADDAPANAGKRMSEIKRAFYAKQPQEEPATTSTEETEVEEGAEATATTVEKSSDVLAFEAAVSTFDEAREKQRVEQDKLRGDSLKRKTEIIARMRELAQQDESKAVFDEFGKLQTEWRELGPVPKEKSKELWDTYNILRDKFYDNVRINKELRDLDHKKNLQVKIELCEKAEALMQETNVQKAVIGARELMDAWKEAGPVPAEKREEVWDRFLHARNMIYDRLREENARLDEERGTNLERKRALIEKAKEIAAEIPTAMRAWQAKSDELAALMEDWKKTGFAPREINEQVWEEFRGVLNGFFKARTEAVKEHRAGQQENTDRKVDLCVQAEALKDSTDWKTATEQFKRLQEEWKSSGTVPGKQGEKLWKRFRTACDAFFQNRNAFYKSRDGEQEDNLKLKRDLIAKVEAYVIEDGQLAFEELQAIQREYMDVGFVPIKLRDELNNRFRGRMNELFEELRSKHSVRGNRDNSYSTSRREPNRPDRGSRPQGERAPQVSKPELTALAKINKINQEITLLENNIEFFANSKNAATLRAEVQRRIDGYKTDLGVAEKELEVIRAKANEPEATPVEETIATAANEAAETTTQPASESETIEPQASAESTDPTESKADEQPASTSDKEPALEESAPSDTTEATEAKEA